MGAISGFKNSRAEPAPDSRPMDEDTHTPIKELIAIEGHSNNLMSSPALRKHHFLKERQDQEKATQQDERDDAPVKKPILLEGHFRP